MPTVSVIIPTFNTALYLCSAIESVLSQTYKDYELIIIDDGSTDDTAHIVRPYQSDKVRYYFQVNRGVNSARNTGIQNANGQLIALLDADDTWHPSKLERQVQYMMNNPQIVLSSCALTLVDENNRCIKIVHPETYDKSDKVVHELYIRNIIYGGSSCVIIRKDCLNTVGCFDEVLHGAEDQDMWLRIAQRYPVASIDEPLANIRIHANNAHKNIPMMKHNQIMFIRKHMHEKISIRKVKSFSYVYLDAAHEYYGQECYLASLFYSIFSKILFPYKIYDNDDKNQIIVKSLLQLLHLNVLLQWHRKYLFR